MADVTLVGELTLEDRFTPGLKRAKDEAKSFGTSIQDAGRKVAGFGSDLMQQSAPLALAFGGAAYSAMKFDESLTNIAAVVGLTRDETEALGDQLLRIGMDSQAGPQAVADSYYDIAGGVADASTHMAILNAAIATAEAGNADLKGTTQALISVMNSYEFSAHNAAYASDVLTRTVGLGVGTMDELGRAMPQVAGLANSLGISFEDLGGMMAFLSTKGNTFAESATQISAMMTAMIKPNEKMAEALEAIGFATGQAAIDTLGLQGAYQAMVSAGYGDQMAAITGSVEALRGVTAMTTPVMDDMADSIITAGPATREMSNALGGVTNALNAMPGVGIIASEFDDWQRASAPIGPRLENVSDAVGKLTGVFGDMPNVNILATDFDKWGVAVEDVNTAAGGFIGLSDKFKEGLRGITEATREIQLTSTAAQFNDMKTDMEGMAIIAGQALTPALGALWTELKPVVGGVIDWVEKNPTLVAGIGLFAMGAMALGGILIPLGLTLGAIGTAFTVIGGGLTIITGVAGAVLTFFGGLLSAVVPIAAPIAAAAGAIVAVGLAIDGALKSWKNWQNTVGDSPQQILSPEGFSNLQNGLGASNNSLGSLIEQVPNWMLPHKAEGGMMMAGVPYRVGERGEETIVSPFDAMVLNNRQTRGIGGGVSIGVLNLYGVNDIHALLDQIKRAERERSWA